MSSTGDGVELLLTWLVGSQGTDRGTSPCVREMMYFLNTVRGMLHQDDGTVHKAAQQTLM